MALSPEDRDTALVGRRCACDGYHGTVRYVGEVPPSKGVWVGVEWDDLSRGKHSGEHEGVQYFSCRQSGSGSFVREKKISLGDTFVASLQKRYGGSEHRDLLGAADGELLAGAGGPSFEVVGVEEIIMKQSQYNQLADVSFRGMMVSSAGPAQEIEATSPNITSLDLSLNLLLPSWEVVAEIAGQLKLLTTLKLSENVQLSHGLPAHPPSLLPAFSSLRALFINKMEMTWKTVCVVLSMIPGLEELHACKNRITDLCPPDDSPCVLPPNLKLMNLEDNQISVWSEILRLENLSQLKTLILNDNHITDVFFKQDGSFPALESLSLNRNRISSWSSLDALNTLPRLLEMRVVGNPVLKDQPSTYAFRQLVIARLQLITWLNGSKIDARERQLAERYYLKQRASEWAAAQASEERKRKFVEENPRYVQLAEAHGLPDEALHSSKPVVAALRDKLISVAVRCPDHPNEKEMTKKLPCEMTIRKLKGLLQRLYKVDSSDQKLSYLDKKGREIELSDDLKQLSFFSVETGDTILLRW